MTPSDDDRIAYLAGEPVESLSDADRAGLDELRSMLSSAAMWDEPDPGLEDRIVSTITEAASQPRAAAGTVAATLAAIHGLGSARGSDGQ